MNNKTSLKGTKKKPAISLNLGDKSSPGFSGADQTPTPTRFIRSCEEVGLFQDLQILSVNPFDANFKNALEPRKAECSLLEHLQETPKPDDMLHTPKIFPHHLEQASTSRFEPTQVPVMTLTESHQDDEDDVIFIGEQHLDILSTLKPQTLLPPKKIMRLGISAKKKQPKKVEKKVKKKQPKKVVVQKSKLRPIAPAIKPSALTSGAEIQEVQLIMQTSDGQMKQINLPTNVAQMEKFDLPTNVARIEKFDLPTNVGRIEKFDLPTNVARNEKFDLPTNVARIEKFDLPTNVGRIEKLNLPTSDGRMETLNTKIADIIASKKSAEDTSSVVSVDNSKGNVTSMILCTDPGKKISDNVLSPLIKEKLKQHLSKVSPAAPEQVGASTNISTIKTGQTVLHQLVENEEQLKDIKRKERNRMAACRSRAKRKIEIRHMKHHSSKVEIENRQLRRENTELKSGITALTTENAELRKQLKLCHSCFSDYFFTRSVPTEIPAEVPTEIPTEVPTEVPAEVLMEIPVEVPTEIPAEVPTEVPAEVLTEIPVEVLTEVPVEVLTEVPVEVLTEIPVEVLTEIPAEVPTEIPAEVPAEVLTEVPAEEIEVSIAPYETESCL